MGIAAKAGPFAVDIPPVADNRSHLGDYLPFDTPFGDVDVPVSHQYQLLPVFADEAMEDITPRLQLDQQDIYISGDELPGDGDEQTQEQQDGADDNAGNDGEYYDNPEDVPDDGVEYYDEQGEDTGTPGEDTGNDDEYYDVPVPAPDENMPSPNDNPLAPDENTPVPDENTPVPDKETPAPDENEPAPDDGGDDNGEDDGWYDM